jgi:hypothetical protein
MEHRNSSHDPKSIKSYRHDSARRNRPQSAPLQDCSLTQQSISAKFTQTPAGETANAVTQKRRRRYKPRARRCACGCGQTFAPKLSRGRYIDMTHRNRAHRRKQRRGKKIEPRQQRLAPMTCAHCGKLYWGNPARGQRYCSGKCRNAAYRCKRSAAANALASLCPMPIEKALDVLDAGGLRWVSDMLRTLGFSYDLPSRQWECECCSNQWCKS